MNSCHISGINFSDFLWSLEFFLSCCAINLVSDLLMTLIKSVISTKRVIVSQRVILSQNILGDPSFLICVVFVKNNSTKRKNLLTIKSLEIRILISMLIITG